MFEKRVQKSPDIQNLKNSGDCDTIILRLNRIICTLCR
nr:MAG TPA: hypothetical protein [Caudoviricetes sp.]